MTKCLNFNLLQADFKGAVASAHGFAYRPERPQAKGFVAQKWAWTGTQPGRPSEGGFNRQHAMGLRSGECTP